jgi:transketolase
MKDTVRLANSIRRSALKMVHRAKASHIGSALSIVDILAVLYGKVLRFQPSNSTWPQRDRLILSKGHACVAVYASLAEVGLIKESELNTYGEDFSWLMNHVSHKVNGVEFSTGSLGHGLPFGVGKALFAKSTKEDWRTFVIASDGEMDEGSNWEALLFAAHKNLTNLTLIIDYNKLQSLDSIENTLALEPLIPKLEAFNCSVREVDGHNHEQLLEALSVPASSGPLVVVAHTIKGKGVSFMENSVSWHYKNPSDKELETALIELGEVGA